MRLAPALSLSIALLVLAACGQGGQPGGAQPEAAPARPVIGTEIFRNESVLVSLDAANVYIEANCEDPAMDNYLFLHFVDAGGVNTNADFGFDQNAPLVNEGPPRLCRAARPIPAGTTRVEVGQMVIGGSYIWNVTYDLGS